MSNVVIRTIATFVVSIACASLVASAQQRPAGALPDWSGVWQMVGPTVFDTATVEPPNGRAGDPGVRERPPYNDEWEGRYKKNIDAIQKGVLPDPVNICGTPHGFPRVLNLPDVYEFVVRPEQVDLQQAAHRRGGVLSKRRHRLLGNATVDRNDDDP